MCFGPNDVIVFIVAGSGGGDGLVIDVVVCGGGDGGDGGDKCVESEYGVAVASIVEGSSGTVLVSTPVSSARSGVLLKTTRSYCSE